MATIKSYTDVEQSKKLAEILSLESADMWYQHIGFNIKDGSEKPIYFPMVIRDCESDEDIPCWSLAALLNILHSGQGNIPSLSGGGYQDGKYISDWCLDYEYDNGDYQKTFADNPIDACVEMIEKLHKLKML